MSSKFFGCLFRVDSVNEVTSLIEQYKKSFPKANHYPFAYIVDSETKSSDDGEPGGSAGKVILELLKKEEINKSLLIVARYFGGRELGVGRLSRTFLETAKGAISKASFLIEEVYKKTRIEVTYSDYEFLKRNSSRLGILIKDLSFKENVQLTIYSKNEIDFKELGISYISIESLKDETLLMEETYD